MLRGLPPVLRTPGLSALPRPKTERAAPEEEEGPREEQQQEEGLRQSRRLECLRLTIRRISTTAGCLFYKPLLIPTKATNQRESSIHHNSVRRIM